jgi:archaellum biogenesis ATPase FlaH
MRAEIENCLARIRDDHQIIGAGILVGDSHVITCAHVVNHALGKPKESQARPEEEVRLDFPFLGHEVKTARVVNWRPIQQDGSGDIAVLLLDEVFDQAPEPVLFADAEANDLRTHEFETYGFPLGQDAGVEAHGKLLGRRPDGSIQIESDLVTGYRVQSGFSGAPVRDKKLCALVGMVAIAERQADVKAAFIIPTKLLVRQWPELSRWTTPPYPCAVREYMQKIPGLYREVEKKTGNYVRLSAKLDNGEEIPDLIEHLKAMLLANADAFVLILGDYGSGKTKLAYRLAYELAEEARIHKMRTTIPFYLLLSYSKDNPISSAIPQYLKRYNINLEESDFIDIMNRQPNLVLVLDGFDEMANRTDWDKVPEMINILKALKEYAGVRVIVTSRKSFFRDQMEVAMIEADKIMHLSELGDSNIEEYLEANEISKSAVNHFFKHYPEIKELCRLPIHIFLLSRQLAAVGDVIKEDFLPIDLYKSFIEKVLVQAPIPEWPAGGRREFLQKLAYQWFRNEIIEIRPPQMREIISSELPHLGSERLQELTMHFLSSSLFYRIVDNYRFLHYSFVEFFVAEVLVDDLYSARFDRLGARTLYAEVFDFMSQLIRRKGVALIPIEEIVASQNENVLSNFLAAMTRYPVVEVKPYFERLLVAAEHDLVRCLACGGLGLYDTVDAEVLRDAFSKERNSVIKSLLRRIAEHMAEKAASDDPRKAFRECCAGHFEFKEEDAERILKTKETSYSLHGYRRALRVGDRRWTTTVAAIYLLAGVGDKPSYAEIRSLASSTKVPAIKKAYSEIEHLLN